MSIHCVRLPTGNSDSDSDDSDFEPPPPPVRHQAPKRSDSNKHNSSPFEISESNTEADLNAEIDQDDVPAPSADVDLTSLGLPPLSFDSDPFLSPIQSIQFTIRRHRIWIRGVKGVKFTCTIGNHTVLVAKRKMKYLKKTWFMSRSMNFSVDTPDLTGIFVMQRKGISFSLFSPKERQEDQCHEALAAINIDKNRHVVICHDLWLKPQEDDIFHDLQKNHVTQLIPVQHTSKISSVKNGAFKLADQNEPCFISEKQEDESVLVTAKAPLSMTQAFGIALSLFLQ